MTGSRGCVAPAFWGVPKSRRIVWTKSAESFANIFTESRRAGSVTWTWFRTGGAVVGPEMGPVGTDFCWGCDRLLCRFVMRGMAVSRSCGASSAAAGVVAFRNMFSGSAPGGTGAACVFVARANMFTATFGVTRFGVCAMTCCSTTAVTVGPWIWAGNCCGCNGIDVFKLRCGGASETLTIDLAGIDWTAPSGGAACCGISTTVVSMVFWMKPLCGNRGEIVRQLCHPCAVAGFADVDFHRPAGNIDDQFSILRIIGAP